VTARVLEGGAWVECAPGDLGGRLEALRAGGAALRGRSTAEIASDVGAAVARWVEAPPFADDVAWIARESGLAVSMVEWSLVELARRLTPATLVALVEAELGSREPFQAPRAYAGQPSARGATPPRLLFTVLAETVTPVALETVVLGLLCRAPHVIKCASGDSAAATSFLRVLAEVSPSLASQVLLASWDGAGHPEHAAAVASLSDVVVAYGSNASVDAVRVQCTFPTRFFGYGHRVSFGVVGAASSARANELAQLAQDVALDVAAYDQRGCMSPHAVFVSRDAPFEAAALAEAVGCRGLPLVASRFARGVLPAGHAAELMQQRAVAEFAGGVFEAGEAGTVLLHDALTFPVSPGGRVLHVVPFEEDAALLAALAALRGAISTVGLWGDAAWRAGLVEPLARLGARRICRLGRMQRPVFVRDHDGRPRISDWVEWVDVEPFF
jgi:hypothetical protein